MEAVNHKTIMSKYIDGQSSYILEQEKEQKQEHEQDFLFIKFLLDYILVSNIVLELK